MIEILFFIWLIGSCINAVLIVYYFWPVQTSELIIWASVWPLWWALLLVAIVFLVADHFWHKNLNQVIADTPAHYIRPI
jgi:hypothetical protein